MEKPSHIAVLRLSAMGDVAMTIPVLRVFCATYPDVKVTVVSKQFLKPLFEELPEVSFFPAEVKGKHKGWKGLLRLSRELEQQGVDGIADLHNVLRSKIIRTLFKWKGIPTARIHKGRAQKKALTRFRNKKFVQLPTTFDRYANVFHHLGLPIDLKQHSFPKRKELPPALLPLINKDYKKHLGIAPFAAFEGKMYPLEQMEKVIKKLHETGKVQVFLFGGGISEVEKLDEIAQKYPSVMNVAGALAFEEELCLIANLDAMLAMDSGNAHLAAIYDVPTVTVWGVTHPYAGFYPFQQPPENALLADRETFPKIPTSVYGNKYPEGYEKAIAGISVDAILQKVLKVLSEDNAEGV